MASKRPSIKKKRIDHYADGSIKAHGWTKNGKLHGHWRWYRRNGVILRSGHFKDGKQVGEWITYDQSGNVYKITDFDS